MSTIKILAVALYLSIVQQFSYVFGSLVLHPNPVSNFNLRDEYEALCLFFSSDDEGKIAYVSGGKAGTFIISLENPQIQTVLTIIPGVTVQHALRFGDYLFTADQFDGVSIYEITNLKNPILLTNLKKYAENTQFSIVTSDGRYLFILNSGLILLFEILDIKSPTHLKTFGVSAPYPHRLKFNVDETFIAVSNHLNGVQIIDIRNMPHPVIRVNKNPSFVTWDCVFTNEMKVSYAADAYFGLFIADISPISSYSPTNTTLFEPNWELIYPVNGALMMSLHITQDNSHLLIGFRSIGIYLFSVNKDNYKEITFVQHLQGSYMPIQIFMPKNNESLLLSTNGHQFFVFEAVSPILNQEFPNLLNTFQSNLKTRTFTQVNPFVYCMKDAKHIISLSIDDNFTIYNIEDPYQLKKVSSVERGETQGFLSLAEVSSNQKYLYIASSNSGVLTYDISSLDTPIFLNQYYPQPKEQGNQALQVLLNPSNTIGVITNSFYGIQYVDTTDPANIKKKSAFNEPQECGFLLCNLLKDEVRIICSCREIGIFFFQVEETGVISLKSVFKEIGSESQVVSSDESIIYACLGFQGVYIIDISDFENPKQLSRLVVKGWAQYLWTLFNEKYLIVAQAEKGQLSLINIEDSKKPYIQQLLEFQDEDSITICVPEGEKMAFFSGNQGLRYVPIVTDLKIHTQIQIKKFDSDGNLLYYNTLKEGESLLVGQVAQFTFVPLFTEKKVKITGVKYYRYFEKQTLPSWMNYLPDKRQILMTVDKSGVMNDFSTESKGENILILEVLIQVKADQLELAGLISPGLSTHLITVLKDQGYLDYYGMLTDKLDSKDNFNLDFFDTTYPKTSFSDSTIVAIRNRIKKVLVFSKYDYPIRFFIQSSLKFAYNKDSRVLSSELQGGRNLGSTSPVVSTPSTQIKVFMQILKNGKFVKRTFEGVLASFSDDLTSVSISGQTSYVDSILQKNIQVSNSTVDLSEVPISILVQDSSNFDLQINTSLIQLEFASFHKPVVYNTDKLLSDQLNLIYAGGDLPVEQRFQFSFNMETFTQQDSLPITYNAFIINSDGSETEILTGLWIEFNNISLGFSGIKTIRAYRDSVTIKIIAFDSYSKASSTFEIYFWTIPFFYIIQVGVSVIGPLLGVLGIWKYRHEIHLFFVVRQNVYSDEIAIMGNTFKKQIILLSSIQSDGQKLWKHFEHNSEGYLQKVISHYQEHKSFDMPTIMEDLERFYLPIQNQFSHIDPREFDFNDSRLVRAIKQILFQNILSLDNNTKKAIDLLRKHAIKELNQKDWYKMYIQIIPKIQIVKNKVVRNILFNAEDGAEQKKVADSRVDAAFLQDKIELIKFNPILEASEGIEIESVETNQVSLRQIPFLSPTVSQPLNNEITQLFEKTKATKKHKNDQSKYQFFDLNPFPEMVVKDQVILETLKLKNFQEQYDFNLLSESIALEASGFSSQPPSSINPSVGESIHQHQDNLLTISAYKRNKVGIKRKVMEFLNMDYVSIGLVKNNPLPKWLNYQIIDGIINFWGVPTLSDESEILIRIINKTLFTVHSFRILVQDKERHDCRDRNLLRKVTKKFGVNQRGQRSKLHSTVRMMMTKSNLINSEAINLQSDNNIFHSQELKNLNTINHHQMKQEVPLTGDILIEFEDDRSSRNEHQGEMQHY